MTIPPNLLAAAGALAGYILLMWSSPVRASLVDGGRILRRYPRLAFMLGLFGFGYALFQMALRWSLPAAEAPPLIWNLPVSPFSAGVWSAAAGEAVVPTLDSTAGLFNNLVSTFPLAALAALLLIVNWSGAQGVLWSALRRRCGWWAVPVHAGILLCAVAAMAKPALYFLLPMVEGRWGVSWSPIVAWLAFLFEYLFGVGVQLYGLMLSYCWLRGLTVRHARLLVFTIRRFSFVLRWAGVVMVLSTVFIDFPLIAQTLPVLSGWFPADPAEMDRRALLARLILDGVFLAGATVQITLMLHNESLRRSWREHGRFVRRHWWPLAWFILLAGLHFFALHFLNAVAARALGEGTGPALLWSLFFPWLAGVAGAWLLASWVSMFKRTDLGRLDDPEWVRF